MFFKNKQAYTIMKLIITISLIALHLISYSQSEESDKIELSAYDGTQEIDTNEIYQIVNVQPEFPGGASEMMKYLKDSINYPKQAVEENKQGRAYISFVVERNGTISNVKNAYPSNKLDKLLIEEALRVVESMPKWEPGKQRGKAVRVKYTVPVLFRLNCRAK